MTEANVDLRERINQMTRLGQFIRCQRWSMLHWYRHRPCVAVLVRPADIPDSGFLCDLLWSDPSQVPCSFVVVFRSTFQAVEPLWESYWCVLLANHCQPAQRVSDSQELESKTPRYSNSQHSQELNTKTNILPNSTVLTRNFADMEITWCTGTGSNLVVAPVDWEHAFDKLLHSITVLCPEWVYPNILFFLLKNSYSNPKLFVENNNRLEHRISSNIIEH